MLNNLMAVPAHRPLLPRLFCASCAKMKPQSIDMYQPRAREDQVKVWRRMGGVGSGRAGLVGGFLFGIGKEEGEVLSDVGLAAVSETEVPSFGALADACFPCGLKVPFLPSSVTCRMV